MAKNNFHAQEAVNDPNYASGVGTTAAGGVGTGLSQEGTGFGNLGTTLGRQQSFADMIAAQAAGRGGPTMADQALKDATLRNNANLAGAAASDKTMSPALAKRQALMAAAGNNQQAAGQAAQTHVQEQPAAQGEENQALANEGNTSGAMTSAGTSLLGTSGGVSNTSNQNLISSRDNANQINEQVAAQNASMVNGAIGGLMSGAGAAFGVAHGGEIPSGTQPLARGGMVHESGGGEGHVPRIPMPRRSFAAQVAHHLKTEYFDEGGPVVKQAAPTQAPVSPKEEQAHDASRKEGDTKKKAEANTKENYDIDMADLENAAVQKKADGGPIVDPKARDAALLRRAHGKKQPGDDELIAAGDSKPQHHYESDAKAVESKPAAAAPAPAPAPAKPAPAGNIFSSNATKANAAADAEKYADGGQVPQPSVVPNPMLGMGAPRFQPMAVNANNPTYGGSFNLAGGIGQFLKNKLGMAHQAAATMASDPNATVASLTQAQGAAPGQQQTAVDRSMGSMPRLGPTPGGDTGLAGVDQERKLARGGAIDFVGGGPVPGKAKVPGDSPKNDTVPAVVSPGEVVLPRSISHDPEAAKAFVQHLMGGGKKKKSLKDLKGKKPEARA